MSAVYNRLFDRSGYLFVDLRGSCDSVQIADAYRCFATACIEKNVQRAVVATGNDEPTAHYALRDAFTTIVLAIGIPSAFKLALVPSTQRVEAVYRLIERDFRVLGIDAQIFADEEHAVAWLEDQPSGPCEGRNPITAA